MTKQNIHRLAFGGVIAAFVIMITYSAVSAQESGDAPSPVPVRQSDTATSTPIGTGVSGQATATVPDTPGRPLRLRDRDITTNRITIRWAAPEDNGSPITGYTVRYQDRDGGGEGVAGPWSEVSAPASSTSKVVSGLSAATRYNFEIKATNGEGDSDWSPNRYGHTKPGLVSTLSVTAGSESLNVTWSAPSGGTAIESYQVQYKLTSASTWTSAESSDDPPSDRSPFTITGLTNGSRYHVQVRACNRMLFEEPVGAADNCGEWLESATRTPQSPTTPTPTPAPTSTPTPPPPPPPPPPPASPKDCKVVSLGSLGVDRTAERQGVYPADKCRAPSSDPNAGAGGTLYARYYRFSLTETAHVTIDLTSSTADTKLGVFDLHGTNSSNDDNDENPPGSSNTNSRVSRKLEGGREYFIRASLNGTPPPIREFLLSMKTEFWIPDLGYQPDHTVQYSLGHLPATPTPPPVGPVDLSAPGYVVPEAIATAVAAWNNAVSGSWPDVLFCERTPVKQLHIDSPMPCPPDRTPDDEQTVTISTTPGHPCPGKALGCFDPGGGRHVTGDAYIVEPATQLDLDLTFVHVRWTNNYGEHGNQSNIGDRLVRKLYLPLVVMHELGHAAGLEDLYLFPADRHRFDNSIMLELEVGWKNPTITDFDKGYIKQVYRNEHGAKPHE